MLLPVPPSSILGQGVGECRVNGLIWGRGTGMNLDPIWGPS